jgi:hypothetical protein
MPVFAPRRAQAIKKSLENLFHRAIRYHSAPELSSQDIYRMVVKPSDMARLQKIEAEIDDFELQGLSRELQYISVDMPMPNGNRSAVSIHMLKPMRGLLPAYSLMGMHDEEPPHPGVSAWLERRFEIGVKFARAGDAFDMLNRKFSSPAQMKFFFNGVLALIEMCDEDETSKKLADCLRDVPMPKTWPSISRELRDGGLEATRTIANALLFPVSGTVVRKAEVTFSVSMHNLGATTVPWGRNIQVW